MSHDAVDRRKGDKPVPDNLEEYLNDFQIQALRRLESLGYKLRFVRRPLFKDVIAVVSNPQYHKIGMLKEDGSLDVFPDIQLRDWDSDKVIRKLELIAGGSRRILTIHTHKSRYPEE